MGLIVERINTAERLAALVPDWEDLQTRSSASSPSLSPSWVLSWWRVFGDAGKRSLSSLALWDKGRLVGLAPMLTRWHMHLRALPFRRLEPLCSGEDEADEICSEYLGLLSDRDRDADVARVVAEEIVETPRLDEVVWPALSGDSPFVAELARMLEKRGMVVDTTETGRAPYAVLPKTFDAYLGGLPSSHRYMVRRSLREFEKWSGGAASFHAARSPADLAHGARILKTLHGERWAASRAEGVFGSARFQAFHDRVLPALLEKKALDLRWVSLDGEPIGVLYNIVWNGKVHFYQSGRKLGLPKQLRIGIVMHARAIADAIEAGLHEYDFLDGTSRYKLQLATHTRPLVTLRAVRPSAREWARKLGERALDQGRAMRERLIARVMKADGKPTPDE